MNGQSNNRINYLGYTEFTVHIGQKLLISYLEDHKILWRISFMGHYGNFFVLSIE